MAISVNQIKSADWSFKLSEFGEVVEGYEDINQCIEIILNTSKGADCFRPLFGADLLSYADLPINTAGPQMVREILEALAIWETRIEVTSVSYTVSEASINFSIKWVLVENRQQGVANVALQTAPSPSVTIELPPTVTGLIAEGFRNQINLSWSYPLGAVGNVFQIWRSSNGINFEFLTTQINKLSYTDTLSLPGTYYYKVRAVNSGQFGLFSNIASAEAMSFVVFNTSWNVSEDGAYNPTLSGGNVTWIFGSEEIESPSPSYNGSYLDGTLKSIVVFSDDFDLITTALFANDKTVEGALNLELLTGLTTFRAFFNTTLNEVIFAENLTFVLLDLLNTSVTELDLSQKNISINGTLRISDTSMSVFSLSENNTFTSLSMNNFDYSDVLDLKSSLFSNASIDASSSTITSFDFASSSGNISSFLFSDSLAHGTLDFGVVTLDSLVGFRTAINDLVLSSVSKNLSIIRVSIGELNTIDLGGAIIDVNTARIEFDNHNMTTQEVDDAWIEVNRVALFTAVTRTIDINGNNASPSSNSDSARLDLFLKNYFLIE